MAQGAIKMSTKAAATKVAHSKKQASKITKPKQRSKGNPDKGKKGKKVAKAGGSKRFG
ncbi:unnamed protein product [Clonostachys rosea f. rosea IK726]|uniref:Uncharacterized protein n=2 Tax=Bionectria ochroleuca TaxID=29856 RepID=A0A0B7KDV0_BIOOC|nr:unnamed protein product [Clonostachys rosea f. rosea IK726]